MAAPTTTVLLCDDHQLFADGLAGLLVGSQAFIVDTTNTAQEALEILATKAIEVAIIDLEMPGKDGTELCVEIKKNWPGVRIMVVSMIIQSKIIKQMLHKVGVNAYLDKNVEFSTILTAIEQVMMDEIFVSKRIQNILSKSLPTTFSNREQQILHLLACGMSNKEIAERLFISPHTVDSHKRNLFEKAGNTKTTGALIRRFDEVRLGYSDDPADLPNFKKLPPPPSS